MHFIIFAGGVLTKGIAVEKALKRFDKTIAVDSGASHSLSLGITPDYLVGDFDSIDKKLLSEFEKKGTKILRFPEEKDATDTELALDHAMMHNAAQITILAGISGERTDHLIGNIFLLLKKKYAKLRITFAEGNQEIYLARNSVQVSGKKGDTISFIPIAGSVKHLTSTGLKYDLSNYQISIQGNHGISNVLTSSTAEINFKNKTLLVVHTRS